MKRPGLTFFLLLLIHLNHSAQSNIELGLLPSLNINKGLQNDWSLNFKTESRQSIMKSEWQYDYLLTDVSVAASRKTGINTAIAMGYLVRLDDTGIRNRVLQQFTYVRRYASFRLSHRLAADQTFRKDNDPVYRFRYRLSSEIPLQGTSLNPGEFFLKISNEYLNALSGNTYDLEIRGAAFMGYAISPANKIELGFDFRTDSFIQDNRRNRLWIGLNFYSSI